MQGIDRNHCIAIAVSVIGQSIIQEGEDIGNQCRLKIRVALDCGNEHLAQPSLFLGPLTPAI